MCDSPSITRYVHQKCRCDECRTINKTYQLRRDRAKQRGEKTWVAGDDVRQRIAVLTANGMSHKEIIRAAKLSSGTWTGIMYRHWRTGKPVERVKKETAERIFAINRRHLSKGQQVSRKAMDNRIVEMLFEGYSIRAQSRISGVDHQVLRKYKDLEARTVSAGMLAAYMATTEKALGDWCREDKSAMARSQNESQRARGTVVGKWNRKAQLR